MVLDFDSNIIGLKIDATMGVFDLFDISYDFDFSFEMPSISLGDFEIPSLDLPDLNLLEFKLPSFDLMEFKFPTLHLPQIPDFDWSVYLDLPDLDLNLPSLTLPAIGKLIVNWPEIGRAHV